VDEKKAAELRLQQRMARIRNKIVVLSGKGGVGKSTVAVNLAVALAKAGKRVGLMDIDIHGPSIPTLLGLGDASVRGSDEGIIPFTCGPLKVMSVQFFLDDPDAAIIWRGPMKMTVISQFLSDVNWGDLDYLIVDSPPGTGDEPLSVCQLLNGPEGAVIVTTPQKVAEVDVRKSINFCHQLNIPVLGIVENMSGFVCPHCQKMTPLFNQGAGERLANAFGVPLLASIPFELELGASGELGIPYLDHRADSPVAALFVSMAQEVVAELEGKEKAEIHKDVIMPEKKELTRIVLPVSEGKLCVHFGHCDTFAVMDVDTESSQIMAQSELEPPPHEPGLLPRWLAERGARVIIAGGMGQRAQDLFTEQGIAVVVGAPSEDPKELVQRYLAGTLVSGDNVCDH
jgi:Mrp family chromosome partitioning ATPase/predicted Fe-Mo cluster-binding NifX family protein